MAESLASSGDKRVYNTRSRKRSLETQEKDELPKCVNLEKEEVSATNESEENGVPDCAICLQTCVHPARLPCGHIFCFLCVKGVVHSGWRCAMCRAPIPHDYLDSPQLLVAPKLVGDIEKKTSQNDVKEEYQWFYEGRHGGWWQFEERTASELETAAISGVVQFDTLICGSIYTLDLSNMIQYKKERPWQARKLLRELPSKVERRGIAGIK